MAHLFKPVGDTNPNDRYRLTISLDIERKVRSRRCLNKAAYEMPDIALRVSVMIDIMELS